MYSVEIATRLISGTGADELLDDAHLVNLPSCQHRERRKMLFFAMQHIQQSLAIYDNSPNLAKEYPLSRRGISTDTLVLIRSGRLRELGQIAPVLSNIDEVIASCRHCRQAGQVLEVSDHAVGGCCWLICYLHDTG
jgi:hypothetical protein